MSNNRGARSDNREGTSRKRRIPLNGNRTKLDAKIPSGYVGRWVNDEQDRPWRMCNEAGWQFMKSGSPLGNPFVGNESETRNSDLGTYTSQIVGVNPDGTPLRAYLMVIKKEWYDEDKQAKLKPVDEIERAIKGGKVGQDGMKHEDRDKTYIPENGRGIKIT